MKTRMLRNMIVVGGLLSSAAAMAADARTAIIPFRAGCDMVTSNSPGICKLPDSIPQGKT
jgi:hypothetical protein